MQVSFALVLSVAVTALLVPLTRSLCLTEESSFGTCMIEATEAGRMDATCDSCVSDARDARLDIFNENVDCGALDDHVCNGILASCNCMSPCLSEFAALSQCDLSFAYDLSLDCTYSCTGGKVSSSNGDGGGGGGGGDGGSLDGSDQGGSGSLQTSAALAALWMTAANVLWHGMSA
jgi:uncharacterized membrane protein YgcG